MAWHVEAVPPAGLIDMVSEPLSLHQTHLTHEAHILPNFPAHLPLITYSL